jgi:hypothetical protein
MIRIWYLHRTRKSVTGRNTVHTVKRPFLTEVSHIVTRQPVWDSFRNRFSRKNFGFHVPVCNRLSHVCVMARPHYPSFPYLCDRCEQPAAICLWMSRSSVEVFNWILSEEIVALFLITIVTSVVARDRGKFVVSSPNIGSVRQYFRIIEWMQMISMEHVVSTQEMRST